MWHSSSIKEVLEKLNSSVVGLSTKEVSDRLIKYGKNELPKKKSDSVFKIFLREIINPMVLLLIFVVVVSLLLGEIIDAVVIIFIILVDLILGTYQEYKAEKTAEALKDLISINSNVLRDGREVVINSKDIVVGDIIILDSGDKIVADARIIECNNLRVDESILTGESIAVEKKADTLKEKTILSDRVNMLYAGTSVLMGRAKAIVVSTASDTEIGKIATDVNNVKSEKSPLTIRVEKFSKQICMITLFVAIFIAIILFLKDYDTMMIFASVIALSVSAMPEGLPLALTMALTVSSNRMQKKNVIVKKLNSVESLGSCTVIASDKTGTLTVNEQTAKVIYTNDELVDIEGTGYNANGEIVYKNNKDLINEIAFLGYINNECLIDDDGCYGDSIDIAFHYLGEKANVSTKDIEIISMVPYESENKYSAVFYKINNEVHCTVKGSVEKVLSFCKYDKKYIDKNDELAGMGYRVIALADGIIKEKSEYTDSDISNLSFKGLVGFIDPVRTDVKDSIKKCFNAGIKVLMITGDHPKTAYSIAKELGIAVDYSEVITKEEFDKYNNEFEFDKMIKTKTVFARVTPSDKLKIVESLKRSGEFVAVTGDGVNDAPAIKSANIGIAMGSGTDVAKETASMIIRDDNFTSIVKGVEEGRVAYSNIRKVIYMLLSCGFCEILFFLLSMILDLPMPLIAIQLLWLNVVTDGLQDFALSFEKAEKGIMDEKPRPPKEALFDKTLFREILISGLSMGVIVFTLWFILMKNNISIPLSRGYIMALMVYLQNFQVLNCCSEKGSVFKHNYKSNVFIIITVALAMVLEFIVGESKVLSTFFKIESIPLNHMFMLIIYGASILVIMEVYKFVNKNKKNSV